MYSLTQMFSKFKLYSDILLTVNSYLVVSNVITNFVEMFPEVGIYLLIVHETVNLSTQVAPSKGWRRRWVI